MALSIPLVVCSFARTMLIIACETWPELRSFWIWTFTGLSVLQFLWPAPACGPSKIDVICRSLASWFTYNRREYVVPGLLAPQRYLPRSYYSHVCCRRPHLGIMARSSARRCRGPNGTLAVRIGFRLNSRTALHQRQNQRDSFSARGAWPSGSEEQPTARRDHWPALCADAFNPRCCRSMAPSSRSTRTIGPNSSTICIPLLTPSRIAAITKADSSKTEVRSLFRAIFREHAHFPGDAGAGKTSLGLAPWIEQTILFGDSSVVIIDLKADTLELLATAVRAAEELYERTGIRMPIKFFTNQSHLRTFAFNPLTSLSFKITVMSVFSCPI